MNNLSVSPTYPKKISIALFEPEIPQNTGTIIRLAKAFNLKLFIIHPCGFIWSDKFLKRSAMDYINQANIIHLDNFESLLDTLLDTNNRIIGTVCSHASKPVHTHFSFNYQENDIILFGKESTGLTENITQNSHHLITIPMEPEARSLNLAISVGIITNTALLKINNHLSQPSPY